VILDWAVNWITEQVSAARDEASAKQIAQAELTRVRQVASALNALAASNATPRLADAIAAVDAAESQPDAPLTREEVFSLTTTLVSARWRMRAGK
jgi:hypothetical protein